jgi:endonuclease III
MKKQDLYDLVIPYFRKTYPVPETELVFADIYQITVAVILSAQCTDKRVNIITNEFFRVFPDFKSLAKSNEKEIFGLIKSCSYPNNKSGYLLSLAKTIMENYNGNMPSGIEELLKLPGIGRKSANVIAAVGFGKQTIAVDTHVFRVSQRLGLVTKSKTPLQVENKLIKFLPGNLYTDFHHWLILHGRYICKARKPDCVICGLTNVCIYFKTVSKNSL